MPINPAQIQQTRYDYPNFQPSVMDNFAVLANSIAQGHFGRKQEVQKQLMAAFPTLAANRMVSPGGTPGQPGVVQYGGTPWTMKEPGMDWGQMNQMLLAKERMSPSLSPGTALTAMLNSENWKEIFSQPAEKTVAQMRSLTDAWKKASEPAAPLIPENITTSEQAINYLIDNKKVKNRKEAIKLLQDNNYI